MIAADDAEQAARRLAPPRGRAHDRRRPRGRPGRPQGRRAARPPTCARSASSEVHLTLPATLSAAAADELAAALAPIGITHVALTHADQTARPGAPVELAVTSRRELSYVCSRDAIEPADAEALAKQLLP